MNPSAERPAAVADRVGIPCSGIIPPMVTPLRRDGTPDLDSIDSLVDFLVDHGAAGLLVLDSIGENGELSRGHRVEIAGRTIARAARRVHVMVGLPALGLADAMVDAAEFSSMGADSLLVPAPFAFPHSQSEIEDYFAGVAAAAGAVPLLAHHAPGRTGIAFAAPLLRSLAEQSIIAGVKDSSGDIEGHRILAEATVDLPDFARFTGSELAIDGVLLAGFHGAVPGLANPFIEFHVELAARAAAGDWPGASQMQGRICQLSDLYDHPTKCGSSDAVVLAALKEALVQRGVIECSAISAPFRQPDEGLRAHVRTILSMADDLKP